MGEAIKFQEPGETRGHPVSLRDEKLRVAWKFGTSLPMDPGALGELLRAHLPVIRRFLDDRVNVQVIGREPDPERNAYLAMFLAIDRLGFEGPGLSVAPLEPNCNPAGHAGKSTAPDCSLCTLLRVLASMQGEKLIHVRKVIGHKNLEGRYVRAAEVLVEPGEAFSGFRERIKRLSLPALLLPAAAPAAPAPAVGPTEPGAAAAALASLRAHSWADLNFRVSADGFRVGDVIGTPADLRLDAKGWALFLDLAKARGRLQPRTLGGVDEEMSVDVENLKAALKEAFPQIPGEPVESAGGGYKSAFAFQSGDILPDSGHWGG